MAAAEWQEIPVILSWMLVEEMLRSVVQIQGVTACVSFVELLETRAGRSRSTKMWTDNFVKTVIKIINFSRALVEDMKGTGLFIYWLLMLCYLISVLLVVTTKYAMLRSTFIT